jgi:hypothetical protein
MLDMVMLALVLLERVRRMLEVLARPHLSKERINFLQGLPARLRVEVVLRTVEKKKKISDAVARSSRL